MSATLDRLMQRASRGGWRGITRNLVHIGHLFSGAMLSNGLALVSLAIAARALSPDQFGTLVMVVTYVRLVERLVRFESWQPLVHYVSHLETGASEKLPRLYLFGLLLDVSAALLAAVATVLIANLAGFAFGLSESALALVAIFAVGTLFNITGVPTAALRMAGRFKSIAYVQPVAQILRIPLAAYCWYFASDLQSFVIAWLAAQIIGSALFIFIGYRALAEQSINPFKASPRGLLKEFPGFIGFAWSTNLSMSLRTVTQEADVLLVGFLAAPGAAGIYHVAKRLAKVAQQVGAHTQAVLYPEMARLWADGARDQLRVMALRVQMILVAVGLIAILVAAVLGRPFVEFALGNEYGEVAPVLVTQLIAVTLIMHAAPSRSVLLAMGEPSTVLINSLVATVAFFAASLLLIPPLGAMGASLAQVLFAALTAAWMSYSWRRRIRSATGAPPSPIGTTSNVL